MTFSIMRGNATEKERRAIEEAIAKRKRTQRLKRSRWGQPQLRVPLLTRTSNRVVKS